LQSPNSAFADLIAFVQQVASNSQPSAPQATKIPDPEATLRELKLRSLSDPRAFRIRSTEQIADLLTSSIGTALRAASGVFGVEYRVSIAKADKSQYSIFRFLGLQVQESTSAVWNVLQQLEPIVLYESEGDPSARLVREACSMLSMSMSIYPTPKGAPHYRKQAQKEFGKGKYMEYPFLYDPNTRVKVCSADSAIDYLFAAYSARQEVPWTLQLSLDGGINWPKVTAWIANSLLRLGKGGRYDACTFDGYSDREDDADQPLILWAYEGSPFCKLVRERLSALEIPHILHSTPRGSRNRQLLMELTGRFQVPYLQDPNTGVNLFESAAICEYINKKYGLSNVSVKYL
jgi:Glutathione S-transferase, N-terminal domain